MQLQFNIEIYTNDMARSTIIHIHLYPYFYGYFVRHQTKNIKVDIHNHIYMHNPKYLNSTNKRLM